MIQIYTKYLSCRHIYLESTCIISSLLSYSLSLPKKVRLTSYLSSSSQKCHLLIIQIHTRYHFCGQIYQESICTILFLSHSAFLRLMEPDTDLIQNFQVSLTSYPSSSPQKYHLLMIQIYTR